MSPDDAQRAVAVIAQAREQLRPLAELSDDASNMKVMKVCNEELGGPEGAGSLLRIARFAELLDANGGESLSPAAFARLTAEAEAYVDVLANMCLNSSVLLSLFLTMYVTLAILHIGSPAYAIGADHAEPFRGVVSEPSDGRDGAWGDLASFAWPGDPVARLGLRRGLYVAEVTFICLGVLICSGGLMNVLVMYTTFGAALPDVLSKLEHICEDRKQLNLIWVLFDAAIGFMPFAVGFAAARASAILSLGILSVGGTQMAMLMCYMPHSKNSTVVRLARGQQRAAKRLFHRATRREAGEPGGARGFVHEATCEVVEATAWST
jgi:hypothetical protein